MNRNINKQNYIQAVMMKENTKWKLDKTEINGIIMIMNVLGASIAKLLKIWSLLGYKELNK